MTHHILVLEDEIKQQKALKKVYRKEIQANEYELIFTQTGEEALEVIENDRERTIDFIISDLKLPAARIEGWDFIKILATRNINIKTIVITAVGQLEDFSEQERKNILFFFNKRQEEVSEVTLKNLIEQSFRFSGNITTTSQKVRYNTLKKVFKDLPSKQKIQLYKDGLIYFNRKELKYIENNFSEWINECVEEVDRRDRIRQWLIKKEETGEFKLPISIKSIDFFTVDVRNRSSGIYCEIRWLQDGKPISVHVPKALSDQLLLLLPSNKLHEQTFNRDD